MNHEAKLSGRDRRLVPRAPVGQGKSGRTRLHRPKMPAMNSATADRAGGRFIVVGNQEADRLAGGTQLPAESGGGIFGQRNLQRLAERQLQRLAIGLRIHPVCVGWRHRLTFAPGRVRCKVIVPVCRMIWLVALALGAGGCAVHYFDTKTGTEHLWGFGHMKMKAAPPNEGVQAVVKGTETLGCDIGGGQAEYHVGLGWDYRRLIIISSNASVRLEWPNADFFNVRVGTNFPPQFFCSSTNQSTLPQKEKRP